MSMWVYSFFFFSHVARVSLKLVAVVKKAQTEHAVGWVWVFFPPLSFKKRETFTEYWHTYILFSVCSACNLESPPSPNTHTLRFLRTSDLELNAKFWCTIYRRNLGVFDAPSKCMYLFLHIYCILQKHGVFDVISVILTFEPLVNICFFSVYPNIYIYIYIQYTAETRSFWRSSP